MSEPYFTVFVSILSSFILAAVITAYKLITKRKLNLFLILILISILPVISIFRTGTYQAGDLTLHSVYLQSFFENLKDGILIPQWAGNLCGGHGCPVFMFEYVMPFYIGALFHLMGFSFLDSMKLFLALAFVLSGISMYLFLKEEVNDKAAFTGALLYLFAPIRFIEMHFRVSVGTDAAFIFIPLTFYFAKKSLERKWLFVLLGALNFLFLILSHSSVTLIVVPAAFIYTFVIRKKIRDVFYPFISFVLGLLLSSYYVLPALSEIKYTWYSQTIKTVAEFYPISYYLFSPNRFGLLFWGSHGELRLIVGYAQLLIVCLGLLYLINKRFVKKEKTLSLLLLSYFLLCFILMLSFTKPLWNSLFLLKSFILPWRMLVPISFTVAFLGALTIKNWGQKALIIFCALTVFSTILNWGNRQMVPLSPNAFESQWVLYTEYFEPNNPLYLARYNALVHKEPELVFQTSSHLQILKGTGTVKELSRTQIDHKYVIDANTPLNVVENTFYFPDWKVYVDQKLTPVNIRNQKDFGELTFTLGKGKHLVEVKFEDTPIRTLGKIISFVSLLIIFLILLLNFKNLKRRFPKF